MNVVDLEGNTLGVGEWGEICMRGPNVMLGYWNRPEESAEALRGGWFRSGDIGYVDEQATTSSSTA
jgi:long-chain acyl-CoA synthetase